jgi:hypothetical protein
MNTLGIFLLSALVADCFVAGKLFLSNLLPLLGTLPTYYSEVWRKQKFTKVYTKNNVAFKPNEWLL